MVSRPRATPVKERNLLRCNRILPQDTKKAELDPLVFKQFDSPNCTIPVGLHFLNKINLHILSACCFQLIFLMQMKVDICRVTTFILRKFQVA